MADFKIIETQEELDRIIGERLKREREATEKKYADFDTLKEKAARYDEIAKKDLDGQIKALQEKLSGQTSEVSALTERAITAEKSLMQIRAASKYHVPLELAGRLVGDTEEDLQKDAETFSSFLGTPTAPPLRSTEPAAGSKNGAIDAAYAAALANINNAFK